MCRNQSNITQKCHHRHIFQYALGCDIPLSNALEALFKWHFLLHRYFCHLPSKFPPSPLGMMLHGEVSFSRAACRHHQFKCKWRSGLREAAEWFCHDNIWLAMERGAGSGDQVLSCVWCLRLWRSKAHFLKWGHIKRCRHVVLKSERGSTPSFHLAHFRIEVHARIPQVNTGK